MARVVIEVAGLAQFRRSMKELDAGHPKMIRVALNSVADDFIQDVRPEIPARTGAARASLKAASSQGAARISAGGRRAPYYPWLDFGGQTGRRKSVRRAFFKEGRYIYPTLARRQKEVQEAMLHALTDVARSAGVEVDR